MEDRRERRCRECGKPLADADEGPPGEAYCSQCLIERAERYIGESSTGKPEPRRPRERGPWKIVLLMVLLVCLGVLAWQAPQLLKAFEEPRPIRTGSDRTDALTDQCISNLWQIAHRMQQDRRAALDLRCPASGKPYVMVSGTEWEARCPHPEAHGFRKIAVRQSRPVPELIP